MHAERAGVGRKDLGGRNAALERRGNVCEEVGKGGDTDKPSVGRGVDGGEGVNARPIEDVVDAMRGAERPRYFGG